MRGVVAWRAKWAASYASLPLPFSAALPRCPAPPSPQDSLYEEAALLRQRELELKSRLSGAPEAAPVVPVVEAQHIEQASGGSGAAWGSGVAWAGVRGVARRRGAVCMQLQAWA